jgi:hypothetical protein
MPSRRTVMVISLIGARRQRFAHHGTSSDVRPTVMQVAILEALAGDPLAVDEGAVRRAEVADAGRSRSAGRRW